MSWRYLHKVAKTQETRKDGRLSVLHLRYALLRYLKQRIHFEWKDKTKPEEVWHFSGVYTNVWRRPHNNFWGQEGGIFIEFRDVVLTDKDGKRKSFPSLAPNINDILPTRPMQLRFWEVLVKQIKSACKGKEKL